MQEPITRRLCIQAHTLLGDSVAYRVWHGGCACEVTYSGGQKIGMSLGPPSKPVGGARRIDVFRRVIRDHRQDVEVALGRAITSRAASKEPDLGREHFRLAELDEELNLPGHILDVCDLLQVIPPCGNVYFGTTHLLNLWKTLEMSMSQQNGTTTDCRRYLRKAPRLTPPS